MKRTSSIGIATALLIGAMPTVAQPASADSAVVLPTIPAHSPLRTLLSASAARHPAGDVERRAATGRGDITGDGVGDLVTVQSGSNRIDVHAGVLGGCGAFATSTAVGTTGADRTWIGQGDLTGDGNRDLATLSTDGTMRISAHSGTYNGTSTFNPEFTWATGWGAGNLFTLVDFVGKDPNNPTELDGLADILFRYSGDNSYYLYINEGLNANGVPQLANAGALLNSMQAVTSVSIADVTNDGFPDLYMTFTDGSARLLDIFAEQDSSGTWHEKWYVLQATGATSADVHTLVDVTGDGQPDLVTRVKATGELHYTAHAPVWNPGAPSTLFDPAREQLLSSGWNGYRLVA
jgi:hypothetical protein